MDIQKYKGKIKIEATIEFETDDAAQLDRAVEQYGHLITLSCGALENEVVKINGMTLSHKGVVCDKNFGKIGKFHLKKFVGKDVLRPNYEAFHYSNGFVMATDGHKLAAIKTDYDPALEGKILHRDGYFVDGRVIDWTAVLPTSKYFQKDIKLNPKELPRIIRHRIKTAKLDHKLFWIQIKTDNHSVYFEPNNFLFFLYFLKHFPDSKPKSFGYDRAFVARNEKGDTCMLMPVIEKSEDDWNTILTIEG